MSRRTSRKIDYNESDGETSEAAISPVRTPKKAHKAVKVETAEVVTKIEKSIPVKSLKKVKAEVEVGGENTTEIVKSPAKVKANKAKATVQGEVTPKPKKTPVKRKAKAEDDEDGEGADDPKAKKKRKTKEEKEAEAMPLAERTAIGALKKAMYIGAHVSGAGGMYPHKEHILFIL